MIRRRKTWSLSTEPDMPLYLLDTDIASYAIKGNPAVLGRLAQVPTAAVCISAIVKSELLFGAEISQNSIRIREMIDRFLSHIEVLDFPAAAAEEYSKLRAYLHRRGQLIGSNDQLIAAHALHLGLTLVTNNVREFGRVTGLKLENWAE